jgi:ribosome recycling factor
MDILKKAKLTEDDERRVEKKIQALIDESIESVSKILTNKVKEIMSS